MNHFEWDYLQTSSQAGSDCGPVDIVNQFFLGSVEWFSGAVGLYGKTAWEIHECQTWGKCSIIQAEIALLTLMPFPLWSQGSCWVVAPDGLLNASLSGPAFLMNTAAPAALPLVTGVWLFKAGPPFVYLLFIGCVYPTVPLVSRCQHATREGDTRFDQDMVLSSCHVDGGFFFFFSFLSSSPGVKQDGANFSFHCLFTQSHVEELLFWGDNRAYPNSWFAETFGEACPSVCNLFWFYTSGSFIH